MRKIFQISASYKPAFIYGGPTMSVSTLCENLIKEGILLEVLTTTANGKEDFQYQNGERTVIDKVPVVYFKRLTGDHSHLSPGFYNYLFKNLKHSSIVHIHAWWNLISIGAAFICWLKGISYVLSPRGTLGEYSFSNRSGFYKKFFHNLLGKRLLKIAVFQVSSNKEANDIRNIIPKANISVIPNFINLNAANNENDKTKETDVVRLLFFSRIEQKKGLNFLLQALDQLKFPFLLNIYGEGDAAYIEELKQLIPSQLVENVKWNSAIYGNNKFNILGSHDLLLLPSFDENFANVVIESLYTGTAVVITQNVGLSDYVEKNNFGWICDQDSNKIAQCLNSVSKQKEELTRIRKDAPPKIIEDFEVTNLTRKYKEFYDRL
ncbi:MAG: glycosyltransferase [Segetibacter sp.]